MWTIIKTEFYKLKRYQILLPGLLGMVCSPLLQLFSQLVMDEAYRTGPLDLPALLEMTMWGNATVFMPLLIMLTGGWLIDREYTDDTLKNLLTVPVSFRRVLAGKLAATALLALIFSAGTFAAAVAVGLCAGLPGFTLPVLAGGLGQMAALGLCIYVVVLPLLVFCGRRPGWFMGGSVAAFLLGYACMFFKGGLLRDIYPFSAALTLVGFDTAAYAGTTAPGRLPLAAASLGVMLLAAALLLLTAQAPGQARKPGKTGKPAGQASAPRSRRR